MRLVKLFLLVVVVFCSSCCLFSAKDGKFKKDGKWRG